MSKLSHDLLKSLVKYEPSTGKFTALVVSGKWTKLGMEIGCINKHGYRQICINGKIYRSARLAFFYMKGHWPEKLIDHHDGNKLNNRWDNLRPANHSQNTANSNRYVTKGARYEPARKKWKVDIRIGGKKTFIGRFDKLEDARAAYAKAADKTFGEFANY
jgi:hypothetical protein